jgi:xanthine dehydrogenase YagS FAD-binding subunit
MESFEWVDATSVEHAAALLASSRASAPVVAKAGGIDLIDLMKEGIVSPARVVNLKTIPGLDDIAFSADRGLAIGALATLARIEASADVRRFYPALAEAAGHASTPQIRNAATIGGNLLQRPRCWYYRNELLHGDGLDVNAIVRDGENEYHAIFDNAQSAMVHASTPATALIAYRAGVVLGDAHGSTRSIALEEFLLPPDFSRDVDARIQSGEVLTRIVVPAIASNTRAAYHKQTERDSYDWPICDVAVVLRLDQNTVQSASIVMGWVAPTPRRAIESERILIGERVTDELARKAAKTAVTGATPLSKNAYKIPILEAVVRRTILAAAAGSVAS